ncbi:MAG: hypothetical protein ABIH23_14420 [bacterium]
MTLQQSSEAEVKKFVILWVPPGLNVQLRMHWAVRRRLTETAAMYIASQIGQNARSETSRVWVSVQMYRYNGMDKDGAMGGCKPIFDALVRLGWAKDDRPEFMEQIVLPVKIERGKNRHDRTEITLKVL